MTTQTTIPTANLYDVLDVEPTSRPEEIRAAWRAAVADLDPTERRFRVYNQAAEVLLDPSRRTSYDAELERERGRSEAAEPRRNDRSETGASLLARTHRWSADRVPGWLLVAVAGLTAVVLRFVRVGPPHPPGASLRPRTQAAPTPARPAH